MPGGTEPGPGTVVAWRTTTSALTRSAAAAGFGGVGAGGASAQEAGPRVSAAPAAPIAAHRTIRLFIVGVRMLLLFSAGGGATLHQSRRRRSRRGHSRPSLQAHRRS